MVTPLAHDLYLSDRLDARWREDYVYIGRTSALSFAAVLERHQAPRGGRLLDVGCGSGIVALSLAGRFEIVEGTDIVPRCLDYAKLNAAIHPFGGRCRFYESDLFARVLGEFDVIVSNPPCGWFDPAAESGQIFSSGGAEFGTEIPSRVLEQAYDRLAPGGLICCTVTCPVFGRRPFIDELIGQVFAERPADVTVYPLFSEFSYRRARSYRRVGISRVVRYLVVATPARQLSVRRQHYDRLRHACYTARSWAPRLVARVSQTQ